MKPHCVTSPKTVIKITVGKECSLILCLAKCWCLQDIVAVPWLRQLIASLLPQTPGFQSQCCPCGIWFSPVEFRCHYLISDLYSSFTRLPVTLHSCGLMVSLTKTHPLLLTTWHYLRSHEILIKITLECKPQIFLPMLCTVIWSYILLPCK